MHLMIMCHRMGTDTTYYNADIEGDVNNGAENQEKEEQEEIQGD